MISGSHINKSSFDTDKGFFFVNDNISTFDYLVNNNFFLFSDFSAKDSTKFIYDAFLYSPDLIESFLLNLLNLKKKSSTFA
jgi:hypothetical protein